MPSILIVQVPFGDIGYYAHPFPIHKHNGEYGKVRALPFVWIFHEFLMSRVYRRYNLCIVHFRLSLSLFANNQPDIRMSDYIFFISILVISFFSISSPHPSWRKTILMIRLLLLGFLIVFGCWEDIQVSAIQYFSELFFNFIFGAVLCVCLCVLIFLSPTAVITYEF